MDGTSVGKFLGRDESASKRLVGGSVRPLRVTRGILAFSKAQDPTVLHRKVGRLNWFRLTLHYIHGFVPRTIHLQILQTQNSAGA